MSHLQLSWCHDSSLHCAYVAGPIKATNPERAAKKRAARRKDFAKLARTEGGLLLERLSGK